MEIGVADLGLGGRIKYAIYWQSSKCIPFCPVWFLAGKGLTLIGQSSRTGECQLANSYLAQCLTYSRYQGLL